MIPLLGLNVPWANRPRKRWAARRAVQCLGGFAWRNQAKMLGGCCSGWADRPSRAAITGQARNAAPGIASATIGCHMPTVNRIEQPIPAMQASVIRLQGNELQPLLCIMPPQSIAIVAGAVRSEEPGGGEEC